jgi:hypothetical protein
MPVPLPFRIELARFPLPWPLLRWIGLSPNFGIFLFTLSNFPHTQHRQISSFLAPSSSSIPGNFVSVCLHDRCSDPLLSSIVSRIAALAIVRSYLVHLLRFLQLISDQTQSIEFFLFRICLIGNDVVFVTEKFVRTDTLVWYWIQDFGFWICPSDLDSV